MYIIPNCNSIIGEKNFQNYTKIPHIAINNAKNPFLCQTNLIFCKENFKKVLHYLKKVL